MNNDDGLGKKIKISLVLNTGFAVLEFGVGIFAGSLALMSDAAHNLTDSFSLLVSFFGQKLSNKKATEEHTFGYGKAGILAAFFNSLILVALAVYIFVSAINRANEHVAISGGLVMVVAIVGVFINGVIAAIFYKHQNILNIKTAYVNMLFDTLTSVGALIAGALIYFFGWEWADTVASALIGLSLFYNGLKLVNQVTHVLLEGVPEGLDTKKVRENIAAVAGIHTVDDLHIWSIGNQKAALNCRLIVETKDFDQNLKAIAAVKEMLTAKYKFNHITIELGVSPLMPHEH